MDKILEYFLKIKSILSNHKTRLDSLEKRIEYLECNPWKMPFDNG
jgi:hypothetical protein